jgi:hypothetical protein
LTEIIDVISNTGALNEANASNNIDKKGPWMRLYEGIFSPEFGVARGYQCPFVDGKLASQVKEKFIKEWGPAAKKQMEADAAEGKQSSDSVMLMNSLFVSYNTFCLDDTSKKKNAKEKAMEARMQMNNYECAIGAQPPGAKHGSGVASGLSFTKTSDGRTTTRKRTNVSSKGTVPFPPGGIDSNPGSTIGLVTGVMTWWQRKIFPFFVYDVTLRTIHTLYIESVPVWGQRR